MRLGLRTRAPAAWCRAVAWAAVVATIATGCAAGREVPRPALETVSAGLDTAGADDPAVARWSCAAACVRWRPVLDELDAHRRRAYATGRPRLLHRVYVPGSGVLARDRRMLTAWTARTAGVSGVRLRVLHVRRLPAGRRWPAARGTSVRLRVVDQLAPATVHLYRGAGRIPLPRDLPTSRVIVLRHGPTGWRIAAVR
jgi:hypothetical protein